jgi:hypothetical protein
MSGYLLWCEFLQILFMDSLVIERFIARMRNVDVKVYPKLGEESAITIGEAANGMSEILYP